MKKKNKAKEEEPDYSSLLVFGYGCKIFRDDERAQSIEENLIPWMGTDLTIDRFDGRGHLHNLSEYEAGQAGAETGDDLERHEEELCEEERWRSLYQDDMEENARQEEEDKRAQSQGQFQFNYEETDSGIVFGPEAPRQEDMEDDSEEYVPGPQLDLPPGTVPPRTMKEFSVIEKTAMLIAKQGPQMEILLKAKQADNPVFEFLWMEHSYNKFYRHLTSLVKTKQYRRAPPPPTAPAPLSLVPQYSDSAPDLAPRVTAGIAFKKSEDCAYSQLINKLQKFAPAPSTAPPPDFQQTTESKESSPAPPQPTELVKIPEGPIVIPPPDVQTIIDKTASYVAKNGRSFEEIVLGKDGKRFRFLSPGDRHYNYYLHKLNIYMTGNYDPSVSSEPLAFKLKKKPENPKDNLVSLNNPISGLDYGSDSEDKSEKEEEPENKVESNKSGFPNLKGFLPPSIVSNPKLYNEEEEKKEEDEDEEKKRQEENNKLRDKLAAKAREKMVQVAKEKALQLERKKKAAQFLAQLAEKKTGVSSVTAVDEGEQSSAEEGELVLREGAVAADINETGSVTAVSIWPPPAPPKLVIPRLASDPNSVVELSSDSEDEKPRKRRKRSRSRSRRREKRRKRSRSRSRHRRHRKERRRHSGERDRDRERRRRKRHHYRSSSESEDGRHRRRGGSNSDSDGSGGDSRAGRTEKTNPLIEEIVQPTVNKMTEELRAKVRAMLESK